MKILPPGLRARRESRLVARFPGCDAIVYGHTHVPQVEGHKGVWIRNPGSPTERRSAPERTLELDVTGRRPGADTRFAGGLTERTPVR